MNVPDCRSRPSCSSASKLGVVCTPLWLRALQCREFLAACRTALDRLPTISVGAQRRFSLPCERGLHTVPCGLRRISCTAHDMNPCLGIKACQDRSEFSPSTHLTFALPRFQTYTCLQVPLPTSTSKTTTMLRRATPKSTRSPPCRSRQ